MKYVWLPIFGLILLGGLVYMSRLPAAPGIHGIKFYDRDYFNKGIARIDPASLPSPVKVFGGIVPHDIFPSFIPARFAYYLSKNPPGTIIIIGPNHNEKGDHKVLTSLFSWQTSSVRLQPDLTVIRDLLKNDLVGIDETVLPDDHAAISIMPYLAFFMPKVRVVPLLLSSRLTLRDITSLAETVRNTIKDDTVIIAAVDFSHYLSSPRAEVKDAETLQLIKSKDYRQLLTLGNDHLDSPASISLLLQLMGDRTITVLDHTNSGLIQKNNDIETTSYFSLIYPR